MKVYPNEQIEQGSDEWLSMREGRITGTKLGHLFAKSRASEQAFDFEKPMLGYYQLVAERITWEDEDGRDSNRERGHRLEPVAIDEAEKLLNKDFVRGGVWEANLLHIESPDGFTPDLTEAIEVKCLSSARHLMAIMSGHAPSEYRGEYANYFLVNDKLQTLYVALYDPRFLNKKLQLHIYRIHRKDVQPMLDKIQQTIVQTETKFGADVALLNETPQIEDSEL